MSTLLHTLKSTFASRNPKLESANKIPHLYVPLDSLELIMTLASDIQGQQSDGNTVDFLQMFVQLPFNLDSLYYDETTMLMNYINARIPLLGFIVAIDQKTIAFRYMHLVNPKSPDVPLIEEAVSVIEFAVDTFSDAIRMVAIGESSYERVVDQLPL